MDCTIIYFLLIEVTKKSMAQSVRFSEKLQHYAMGRYDVSDDKFSLFTKIHIHLESITCPTTQFIQLYSEAFVFSGIYQTQLSP
jgi:hypothetical protein